MSKAVFITGTGTDMGKTYLSGLIVKKLAQAGKNPAYYKAAMSGNDRRADGSLIPGDALFVKEMSLLSPDRYSAVTDANDAAVCPDGNE